MSNIKKLVSSILVSAVFVPNLNVCSMAPKPSWRNTKIDGPNKAKLEDRMEIVKDIVVEEILDKVIDHLNKKKGLNIEKQETVEGYYRYLTFSEKHAIVDFLKETVNENWLKETVNENQSAAPWWGVWVDYLSSYVRCWRLPKYWSVPGVCDNVELNVRERTPEEENCIATWIVGKMIGLDLDLYYKPKETSTDLVSKNKKIELECVVSDDKTIEDELLKDENLKGVFKVILPLRVSQAIKFRSEYDDAFSADIANRWNYGDEMANAKFMGPFSKRFYDQARQEFPVVYLTTEIDEDEEMQIKRIEMVDPVAERLNTVARLRENYLRDIQTLRAPMRSEIENGLRACVEKLLTELGLTLEEIHNQKINPKTLNKIRKFLSPYRESTENSTMVRKILKNYKLSNGMLLYDLIILAHKVKCGLESNYLYNCPLAVMQWLITNTLNKVVEPGIICIDSNKNSMYCYNSTTYRNCTPPHYIPSWITDSPEKSHQNLVELLTNGAFDPKYFDSNYDLNVKEIAPRLKIKK